MEILSVCWVNCFQKRDRQMRCSSNIEELYILFLFFVEYVQLLLLGLLFSENKKCVPSLRPQECHWGHRDQMSRLESLIWSANSSVLFFQGMSCYSLTECLSFSPFCTPRICLEGSLEHSSSFTLSDGLLSNWQAWSSSQQLSFSGRLPFTLKWV